MTKLKVFNAGDVNKILSISRAIVAMHDAFIQFSTGKAANPVRTNIELKASNGDILFMPSYLENDKKAGIKIISCMKDNPKIGLPFIQAVVMVFNSNTGRPEALVNGEALTALRTGAASGLATRLLSKKEAESVAIIGAGVQAFKQFEAVCAVRKIKRCIVYDINKEKASLFIEKFKGHLPVQFKIGTNTSELKDYEIICAASSAAGTLFKDTDIASGTHINAIGAFRPDMIEIPNETVARSKIVVDSREAAMQEAGDLIQAIEKKFITEKDIYAEIGEIAAGKLAGRTSNDEVTFFKSVGLAIQDLAAAAVIVNEGNKQNLGQEINL